MRVILIPRTACLLAALCIGNPVSMSSIAMSAENQSSVVEPESSDPVPVELEEYWGAWGLVESDADAKSRSDAIDGAADALPIFVRGIARAIMHRRIQPRARYAFNPGDDGESIRLRSDDETPLLLRLDGIPYEGIGHDGEPYTRTCNRVKSAIEFEWNRKDSRGTSVFRISESGSVLTVVSTIRQEYFEAPIIYQATYHRDKPGASG